MTDMRTRLGKGVEMMILATCPMVSVPTGVVVC